MTKANNKYALPSHNNVRERINGLDSIEPPSANHPPNMKRNCQQNGLKYHDPVGKASRFQSKCLAARYSRNEAVKVRFGNRSIVQRTGGKATISTMYKGSTSMLTGLNARISP